MQLFLSLTIDLNLSPISTHFTAKSSGLYNDIVVNFLLHAIKNASCGLFIFYHRRLKFYRLFLQALLITINDSHFILFDF